MSDSNVFDTSNYFPYGVSPYDQPMMAPPRPQARPRSRPSQPPRETAQAAATTPKDHHNKVYVCGFPKKFPIQAFLDWLKHDLSIEVCGTAKAPNSASQKDALKIWYGNHNEFRWGVIQCLSLCNQRDAEHLIKVNEVKFENICGFKTFYLQFRKYQRKRKNRKRGNHTSKKQRGKQGRKPAAKTATTTAQQPQPQPQYQQMHMAAPAPMTPHFAPIPPMAPNPYAMHHQYNQDLQYVPPLAMGMPVAMQQPVYSRPPIVPVRSQALPIMPPSSIKASQPESQPEYMDAPGHFDAQNLITPFAQGPAFAGDMPMGAPPMHMVMPPMPPMPSMPPMQQQQPVFTPQPVMRMPMKDAAGEYHVTVVKPPTDSTNSGFQVSKPRRRQQPTAIPPSLATVQEELTA